MRGKYTLKISILFCKEYLTNNLPIHPIFKADDDFLISGVLLQAFKVNLRLL